MGKKIFNPKLLKSKPENAIAKASPFNNYANRLVQAKKKKAEKMGDTKKRLMEAKKNNKIVKVSKKTNKYALL
jgi:hypothetical protein